MVNVKLGRNMRKTFGETTDTEMFFFSERLVSMVVWCPS